MLILYVLLGWLYWQILSNRRALVQSWRLRHHFRWRQFSNHLFEIFQQFRVYVVYVHNDHSRKNFTIVYNHLHTFTIEPLRARIAYLHFSAMLYVRKSTARA